MKKTKINYANVNSPVIEALTKGLFRFEEEKKAIEKLENIFSNFIISRKEKEEDHPEKPCAVMWIKGFDVTKKEKKEGSFGNYAFVTYEQLKDGLYTLSATKLETELKYHPQKKRQRQRHPNWGHPILRAIKKKKVFKTIQEAQSALQKLHIEHPDTTIPGENKLHIMVYSRKEDPKNPIKKYLFVIKPLKEGGCVIDYKQKNYKAPSDAKTKDTDKPQAPPEGFFASKIQLSRKKKRK